MFASLHSKAAAGAAALAAVGLLLAPTAASAQSYGYQGDRYGSNYDQRYDRDRYSNPDYCRSDRGQRQAAGATFGAGLGAIAGSQLAARGRRTEGSILGGVLGAVVGAGVGNSSAGRCESYDQTRSGGYYDDRGYQSYDRNYDDRYNDRYTDQYNDRYNERYDDRTRYEDRGRYDNRYGCRTVESRTRDWNGRLVTRYEQVCDGY